MRALTVEEYKQIIAAMETGSEGRSIEKLGVTYRKNLKIATALKTQALTGLRIGDVLELKLSSFVKDQQGNYRFDIVEQKTGKPRNFQIPRSVYDMLATFAIDNDKGKNDRLFDTNTRNVQKYLAVICADLELKDVSTHSFRKLFATTMYERSGHDIEAVRRLLQHSSATVTQRYIGIEDSKLNDLASSLEYE